MPYKAKPGDKVRLLVWRGGAAKVGEIGVVRYISGSSYAIDFPSQSDYMVRAGDFSVEGANNVGDGKVAFDSVIIDDFKREQIVESLEQIKHQDLIFVKWGFNKTFEKGRGISMLFYGPPGTGKTLMAQAIADRLGYELKVIATAEIESSEPGQAERNIRAYFKDGGQRTILLFDECDSLIYDRSTVGAIMGAQVNELLSSLEKFDGVTIFTTNRLGTLDEAVNRRLSLKLEFSMPTAEQRVDIWKRMFPTEAPLDSDVNWMRLANVEITGGYIKNAVLRAARMAACQDMPDTEKTIRMEHLVKALKLEVEAMMQFDDAKKDFTKIGQPGRGVNQRVDVVRDAGKLRKAAIDLTKIETEEVEKVKAIKEGKNS